MAVLTKFQYQSIHHQTQGCQGGVSTVKEGLWWPSQHSKKMNGGLKPAQSTQPPAVTWDPQAPSVYLPPGYHSYTSLPSQGSTGIWFKPESAKGGPDPSYRPCKIPHPGPEDALTI